MPARCLKQFALPGRLLETATLGQIDRRLKDDGHVPRDALFTHSFVSLSHDTWIFRYAHPSFDAVPDFGCVETVSVTQLGNLGMDPHG